MLQPIKQIELLLLACIAAPVYAAPPRFLVDTAPALAFCAPVRTETKAKNQTLQARTAAQNYKSGK